MCTYNSVTNTYYIVSMGKVLAEYGSLTGSPRNTYIYAGDQRIGMRNASGQLHYYLNDHLGSARVVIDSVGNMKDYYKYYAYGNPKEWSLTTNQPNRYTGKPYDEEKNVDLYYYGARYYDSERGIFTQIDPLRDKYPGWGPYVYCLNNPLAFKDPDGRKVEFAATASAQFKADFAKAIKYMNDKGISGTFAKLQRSSETVYVGPAGPGGPQYHASSNAIDWDPKTGAVFTSGETVSPSIILLHEGAHALNDITDPKAHAQRALTDDKQYGNMEERQVIEKVETPAAKKAGEGTRTDHKAVLVPVTDPTQRPTPPPPPPPLKQP